MRTIDGAMMSNTVSEYAGGGVWEASALATRWSTSAVVTGAGPVDSCAYTTRATNAAQTPITNGVAR